MQFNSTCVFQSKWDLGKERGNFLDDRNIKLAHYWGISQFPFKKNNVTYIFKNVVHSNLFKEKLWASQCFGSWHIIVTHYCINCQKKNICTKNVMSELPLYFIHFIIITCNCRVRDSGIIISLARTEAVRSVNVSLCPEWLSLNKVLICFPLLLFVEERLMFRQRHWLS